MRNLIVCFLLVAGAPCDANDASEKALRRLIATESRPQVRLRAVDELAEQRATALLLDAWTKGGENLRLMAPTCFHAIGVRGLGDGLTAMSSEDPLRRAAGAVLLGSIGPDARLGVRKLLAGLRDDSELVRIESARALGNIGAPAQDAISGLIAMTMQDPDRALLALQAMTRVTLDFQLRALRKPAEKPLARLVDRGQSWLRLKEQSGGTWGDPMTDALVLLAFLQGGINEVNRPAVNRAVRGLVLRYYDDGAPPPLIAALVLMAWREMRDPLYLMIGNRMLERMIVTSTDGAKASNLHALALRQAQWAGDAVNTEAWNAIPETTPVLLRRVLLPGTPDPKAEHAQAERMVAKPLKWVRDEPRWEPRTLVREAWAINLAGGEPRQRFREMFFAAVFPKILPPGPGEPPTVGHWEPPGGNNANGVSTTAAIVSLLRMYADQYPPRRLPMPKEGKHRAAVHALNGALKHPSPEVRAYARAMLTLWAAS